MQVLIFSSLLHFTIPFLVEPYPKGVVQLGGSLIKGCGSLKISKSHSRSTPNCEATLSRLLYLRLTQALSLF